MTIQRLLDANQTFLSNQAQNMLADGTACNGTPINGLPCKALAIVTCIDTRLVQFLEPALGLARGEATIIKNAGNIVGSPDSDIIRSLVVAVHAQQCREIAIIGHTDCGMARLNIHAMTENMLASGIEELHADWQKLSAWLGQFTDEADNVIQSVHMARSSGKIPLSVPIHGLILNVDSGELKHLITL